MSNVREYLLDNMSELKDVVRELNSWNGCLDQFDVWENDEEFFNTFFEGKPMEAVRACCYGDYEYMDAYVRFNGYGNLESLGEIQYENELKEEIDYIIDLIKENEHNIDLSSELSELLEEDEEEAV